MAERDRLDFPDGQIDLGAVKALRAHITDAIQAARIGTPPPPAAPLAQLAGEAAALLASPSVSLIRRCQAPDVARYYQRHKDATPPSNA